MRSLLIKSSIRLVSLLPLSVAQSLGNWLGHCFYLFPTKLRRTTEINIRLCLPELDSNEKKQLIKASLSQTGIAIMEIGAMLCRTTPRLLTRIQSISGKEHLDKALEAGKGVILLTPHLGCWEIAGLYVGQHYQATTLYKPPKIKALASWLKHARQRSGATLVSTKDSGPRQLLKKLRKDRGVIALLPDQEPPAGAGLFSPFFGVDAYTMTLATKLSKKTGAKIIFGFAERLNGGRGYRLHAIPAEKDIYDDDLSLAITSMNKTIEQCIRQVPHQYQWSYKRFRKRPEGSNNPYR